MFMRHTKKCLQLLEGTTGSQQPKSHQLIKEKVRMDDQESLVPAAGKDTSKDCTSQTTPITFPYYLILKTLPTSSIYK